MRKQPFWLLIAAFFFGNSCSQALHVHQVGYLVDQGELVHVAGISLLAVVEDESGDISGASAVVDKDLASSLLARELGAEVLVITTGVEKVYLDYGKPGQRALDAMTAAEAKRYKAQGHFKPGSMLPKVQAIIEFLEGGGRQAIITDPEHLAAALEGRGGTRVRP